VLMPVTKSKPPKHAAIFTSTDAAIITQADLADAVEFPAHAAYPNIGSARRHASVQAIGEDRGRG
jgi:Ni2+-binding GTPase involved in maturation of urease and hydrogenase